MEDQDEVMVLNLKELTRKYILETSCETQVLYPKLKLSLMVVGRECEAAELVFVGIFGGFLPHTYVDVL